MLTLLRNSRFFKALSVLVAFSFISDIVLPPAAMALTGGPSQPEVQSFEPIGTSEMVDVFSGDFVYNIPLMDIGGYPINLSYHSGVGMDQEASWVGLGWNINAGVITRGMRGIPDDFDGDLIKKEFNVKENTTIGGNLMLDVEFIGLSGITPSLSVGFGLFHNNYKGAGYEFSTDASISIGDKGKTLDLGIGLTANSQEGIGVNPSVGASFSASSSSSKDAGGVALSAKVGAPYNSRSGLKAITMSGSASIKTASKTKKGEDRMSSVGPSPNGSAAIPVGNQTYIPQVSLPMKNTSFTFSAGLGGEFTWVALKGRLVGYYNSQKLMYKEQTSPAYGYLYSQNGQNQRIGVHDFNREKEGSFTKTTPGLPLTNYTYDIYNVAGQGIGGMYRPFRNDVGTVYDASVTSISTSTTAGADLTLGNLVKGGANFGFNFNVSTSGNWTGGNQAKSDLSFKGDGAPLFEPFYFKQAGEMVAVDEDFHASLGGDNPVRLPVTQDGIALKPYTSTNDYPPTRTLRERRNQAISILTAAEAEDFALSQHTDPLNMNKIASYEFANPTDAQNGIATISSFSRTENASDKHISELSVLRPDGARYMFGIPAYNTKQREVSFNVEGNTFDPDCSNGLIGYSGYDNSTGNERGIDHYFSATEMPPYAHSYLLTAVLSPDYVDLTGDGPTNDDLGTYTKLNYTRVYGGSNPYHWRIPVSENKANHNQGLRADEQDDKGSYIYGQKEIWYLHSIETKTHIAEFTLSDREDSYGVQGENGTLNSGNPMKELDKITLYAKCDRQTNGADAEIIKQTHFEYDYSLCPCVPNNINTPSVSCDPQNNANANTGKLTLKKVFFTYGKSQKGKLSPYEFIYADSDHDAVPESDLNPAYNMKAYDRWGNFKPNNAEDCDDLLNSDFPYVQQDKGLIDRYAAAWSLTTIGLPSGGAINIDYESDDYAYVQNKRAMQMFIVKGLGAQAGSDMTSSKLFQSPESPNLYVTFNLPVSVQNRAEFRRKYLEDENGSLIQSMYFKFLIDVIGKQAGVTDPGKKLEYVTGYADIVDFGLKSTTQGWVKLKCANLDDGSDCENVNPISKAAWQLARLFLSKLVYPGSDPNGQNESAVSGLLGMLADIQSMFTGMNASLRRWGFGQDVELDQSWIRLFTPENKKLGGGVRVKKLTINDKWDTMGGNPGSDFAYGQEYQYTTIKDGTDTKQNPPGIEISSGVAVYEPILGGEENPWREPVAFANENKLAPDDRFYQEKPYGEMFFPGAGVGYSEVTVRNIRHQDVKRTATGFVKHEFYTAKDFPVWTSGTGVQVKSKKPSWLQRILKIDVKEFMTASQGYAIELNDMHGKPKAQWVYAEAPDDALISELTPVSGVEYFYQTQENNPKRLSNKVTAIEKDGSIKTKVAGKEVDLISDMRESRSFTSGITFQGNVDISFAGPFPIPIPSLWISTSKEETRFRSAVMTKVITRYGILDETIAHDLGSRVSTKNLAYDPETGEVLLTRTLNEFENSMRDEDNAEDFIYSFTYPAHWAYDRMGQAYKNLGISVSPSNSQFFVVGDEIDHNGERKWVTTVNSGSIEVKDRTGNATTLSSGTVKILRSGRRNMQTTPVGTVTTRKNPIEDGTLNIIDKKEILNAGAVVFSDLWDKYCECGFDPDADLINRYVQGILGNWRAKKSMLFLTDRTQASLNNNTYTREDGLYKEFEPFWQYSGNTWKENPANWTFTSEVTVFSPFGFELENRDALNRFSSAQYGFDNKLPVAVSSNAEYREIGFDGFEDYDCKICLDDHFSFSQATPSPILSKTESHTGKTSLKLPAGQNIEITKILFNCDEP